MYATIIVVVLLLLFGGTFTQVPPTALTPEVRFPQPPVPPIIPFFTRPPQIAPTTYVLPASAELVVGPIQSTFTCHDRIYGYYADIENNCQVFHVCVPSVDENDNQNPLIYSFFCGNQTIFDQSNLVCAHTADATPCSVAHLFYKVNENFGKTDRPIVG